MALNDPRQTRAIIAERQSAICAMVSDQRRALSYLHIRQFRSILEPIRQDIVLFACQSSQSFHDIRPVLPGRTALTGNPDALKAFFIELQREASQTRLSIVMYDDNAFREIDHAALIAQMDGISLALDQNTEWFKEEPVRGLMRGTNMAKLGWHSIVAVVESMTK